jgi:glycosyltransferase involved in cell wall biosynthesis
LALNKNLDEKRLAIVIPAYKTRFFEATLTSLVAQTDKRFRVYVGDDCSPENIHQLCERFSNDLDLVYKRFDENLGHQSLVKQWNRCVGLSFEPWVWLFSDDDLMEPQCVEAFYQTLGSTGGRYDVYRFNTLVIDASGKVIWISPPHPQLESGLQFTYHRLMFERSSFAQEYIFSRRAFDREGGFVDFPMAWCSDDASWVAFSGDQGIYTIAGPRVRWRLSGSNISTANAVYKKQKIEAMLKYMDWLNNRFSHVQTVDLEFDNEVLRQCTQSWFDRQLLEMNTLLSVGECFHLARQLDTVWKDGFLENLSRLIRFDIQLLANMVIYSRLGALFAPFIRAARGIYNRHTQYADQVEWLSVRAPESLMAGDRVPVTVKLHNTGSRPWRSRPYGVYLSYHWLDGQDYVQWEGIRSPLPCAVEPGHTMEAEILVEAPGTGGSYILELDLVQERVAWFSSKGARIVQTPVRVKAAPL